MDIILSNAQGGVRRSRIGDREYLIAPLTLIVPGVLNGSHGNLFYPQDEVERDPSIWNGVPLVLYHPTKNGTNVSARDPEVLHGSGIGFVYHSSARRGNLTAEGWFDIAATRRVAPTVLNDLRAGRKIELSTGLHTEKFKAPKGATFNGRPYDYIARNYKPDHVAVLPDQVGACSIADGCGVLVNTGSHAYNTLPNRMSMVLKWKELTNMATPSKAALPTTVAVPTIQVKPFTAWPLNTGAPIALNADYEGYEKSYEARKDELQGQLNKRFNKSGMGSMYDSPSSSYCMIMDLYDDRVVYMQGGKYYQLPYEEKNGKCVLSKDDDPEEVRRVTNWEIVANKWPFDSKNRPRSQNTGKLKPAGSGTGKGPIHETVQRGATMPTERQYALGSQVAAEANAGHNPPHWVKDEAKWERAKNSADKGEYDNETYWAVVTHVYERMGGEVGATAVNAFCPTGEGGGHDNTCPAGGGAGGGAIGREKMKAVESASKESKAAQSASSKARGVDSSSESKSYMHPASDATSTLQLAKMAGKVTPEVLRSVAKLHDRAAKAHEKEAAKSGGQGLHASQHKEAADAHRKAAASHRSLLNNQQSTTWTPLLVAVNYSWEDLLTNEELGVNKEFATDEERRAAFAHMREAGDTISKEATDRSAIAKKVNKDRQPRENAKAAELHEKAAAHHAKAGRKKLAEHHTKAAAEHRAKAGAGTTNSIITSPSRIIWHQLAI